MTDLKTLKTTIIRTIIIWPLYTLYSIGSYLSLYLTFSDTREAIKLNKYCSKYCNNKENKEHY